LLPRAACQNPAGGCEWRIVEPFSIASSGFINPLFFAWVFRPPKVLRTVLLAMMPFCWVVFYLEPLYPREGYFLWTASMLAVLFFRLIQ
jgi:hypothetical protein